MIVVNFLGNNYYNLSTVDPDYVKLFLLLIDYKEMFVDLPSLHNYALDNILQMKYKP